MNTDSVELAISFEPELAGLKFVWSEDNSLVYLISDSMENVSYTVTVSTVATDIWGVQMAEPYTFSFKPGLLRSRISTSQMLSFTPIPLRIS